MNLDVQLIIEFINFLKWQYGDDYIDRDIAIKGFKEFKEQQEAERIKDPIITLEDLGEIPKNCDTLVIGITHQVYYNGVDFELKFLLDEDAIKNNPSDRHYLGQEDIDLDYDLYDEILDRIYEPVTTGDMCVLDGKYVKSLFAPEVLERFKFKYRGWTKFYNVDFSTLFGCYEGTDS